MGLHARIMKVVTESGPRPRAVLLGLCRDDKQRGQFDAVFAAMLDAGELRKFGARKDASYGVKRGRAA